MDRIQVSTEVLTDTAQKVENINNKLEEKLIEINRNMNNLEQTWQSDAASDIRGAMNALKPRFDQYKQVVASYVAFLRNAAQDYEQTESSVQTNASAFK